MKKITKEFANKSVTDLQKEAVAIRSQIAKLLIEKKAKPEKDTNHVKKLKKRLAAILTIARQKELTKKV